MDDTSDKNIEKDQQHDNEKLIKARKRKNFTQQEAAEALSVSEASIIRWEHGKLPQPFNQRRLCSFYNLTEEQLGFRPELPHSIAPEGQEVPDEIAPIPLDLPAAQTHLVGRETVIAGLKQSLLSEQGNSIVSIVGMPGVGKSTLATAIARDIAEHFDGVLWTALGPHPNILGQLNRWAKLLSIPQKQLALLGTAQQWKNTLQDAIGARKVLFVIDDVWDVGHIQPFLIGNAACAYLVTTRNHQIAFDCALNNVTMLHELDETQGLHLLRLIAPHIVTADEQRARAIVSAVGGLPLALSLAGHYLLKQTHNGQQRRIATTLDLLANREERLRLQVPLAATQGLQLDASLTLQSIIGLSDRAISEQARQALYALALFPEKPNTFSEEAGCFVARCSPHVIDELVDAGLAEVAGPDRYSLHQVISDYGREHLTAAAATETNTQLIAYTLDYLGTHAQEQLIVEAAMILTALDAMYTRGEYEYLIQSLTCFIPVMLAHCWYELAEFQLDRVEAEANKRHDNATLAKVYLYLGKTRHGMGRRQEALATWSKGIALPQEDACTKCDLFFAHCWALYMNGAYAELAPYLAEGLPLAFHSHYDEAYCGLLRIRAFVEINVGNYIQGEQDLLQGLSIALTLKNRMEVPLYYLGLSARPARRGDYDQAEVHYQKGIEAAAAAHDEQTLCLLLIWRVTTYTMNPSPDLRRDLTYALNTYKKLKNLGYYALTLRIWSSFEFAMNELDEAERRAEEALHYAIKLTSPRLQGMVLTCLAQVALAKRHTGEADAFLTKALPLARAHCETEELGRTLAARGELALLQQQYEHARAFFQEILTTAPSEHIELRATALYGLARVAHATHQKQVARKQGEDCLQLFSQLHHYRTQEVQDWILICWNPLSRAYSKVRANFSKPASLAPSQTQVQPDR